MVATLQDRLRQVEVLEPTCAGRLQLFGLRWPDVSPLGYVTLDEALQTGAFVVTEVSESGSVPTLLVKNDLDARVFLLAGEQLVGAKQNRVLNVSLLVEAHGQLRVPVSCVEVGRWGYRSRQSSSSGWASHGKLRRQMSNFALEGYRAHKQPTSDQGAVWREVSRKLDTLGSHSPSAALDQAYEDHRSRLNEMLAAARVPADCHGVAFAVGGQLAGVDLFDQPATLQKLLPKLVRAYALDALEVDTDPDVDRPTVTTWLQQAPQARFERYDSPGLGDDVRLESEAVVGAGLVLDQTPVHVELFPGGERPNGVRRPPSPPAPVRPDESGSPRAATDTNAPPVAPPRAQEMTPPAHTPRLEAQGVVALATSAAALEVVIQAVERLVVPFESLGHTLARSGLLVRVEAREHDRFDATNPVLNHDTEQHLVAAVVERTPHAGQRVVFTGCGLADNWFAHWHAGARTTVVSLWDWQCLTPQPVAVFAGYQLVLHGWRAVSTRYDPFRLLHTATRGCLFDLCADKRDVNAKASGPAVCGPCGWRLWRMGVSVAALRAALQAVRPN